MVSAICNGDWTSRICVPASSHRTKPGCTGWEKTSSSAVKRCARCCNPCISGDRSSMLRSTTSVCCKLACRSATTRCHPCASTPTGSPENQAMRPIWWPSAMSRRNDSTLCASAATSARQSATPNASFWPFRVRSRQNPSNWCVVIWRPRNWTPISLSWCASSNTTAWTVGSNSATPDSRIFRSAKNKWWLMTTTSAAMASRRARLTWQL